MSRPAVWCTTTGNSREQIAVSTPSFYIQTNSPAGITFHRAAHSIYSTGSVGSIRQKISAAFLTRRFLTTPASTGANLH